MEADRTVFDTEGCPPPNSRALAERRDEARTLRSSELMTPHPPPKKGTRFVITDRMGRTHITRAASMDNAIHNAAACLGCSVHDLASAKVEARRG